MFQVGFLLGSLTGAGAEKTVLTLSSMLASAGHNVDLYLLEAKQDYIVPQNVNLIILEGKNDAEKGVSLGLYTQSKGYHLFVTTRAEFYDSVVCENKYCSVHITPSARIKAPIWKFWHKFRKIRKLKKKFQNKKLIALSQGIKSDLVVELECLPEDVIVINNPFDIENIIQQGNELHNIPSYPYIIHVGSFLEVKRHCDLLNAFAKIENKTIKLLLVGKGKLEDDLKKLVSALDLDNRVVFWGWDANPYRLIKNAKLLVLSSESEGLPRVIIESLLLNVPVVSTDCRSGPNELLIGDLKKFLVPVGDVNALAITIDESLVQYPQISQNDLKHFDSQSVMERYLNLI